MKKQDGEACVVNKKTSSVEVLVFLFDKSCHDQIEI